MFSGYKMPKTAVPRSFTIVTHYGDTISYKGRNHDEAKAAYAKDVIRARSHINFKAAIKQIKSCRVNKEEAFKRGPRTGPDPWAGPEDSET